MHFNIPIFQHSILIADDDRTLRKGLAFELQDLNYSVHEAASVGEVMDLLQPRKFDLVITDLKMPEVADGMKIIEATKELDANTMVLVMTGYGSIELAVEAMKAGADDFVTKDASVEEIKLKAERLLQQHQLNLEHRKLLEENRRLRSELEKKYRFENLIGNSKIFQDTLKLVGKVAEDGHCTVLLQGESGTGKELVARAIHYNSPRREQPYVIANIAAVPDTLLESELFGHVKGAFTDAAKDREGKLNLAAGGTLFLDEIGDIPPKLQVKLLRVLQEKSFEPLGSDETLKVDVRIIAATNQNLQEKIKEKTFREDLFYRLNVVPITLPPLRKRKEDIPLLTEHFLKKSCQERGKDLALTASVMDVFLQYDWPGNIRELENVVEQLAVLATDLEITVRDLPNQFRKFSGEVDSNFEEEKLKLAEARAELVRSFEKRFIEEALRKHSWNISRTAKAIGVSREGLHRMIRRYGLKRRSE
ncbi:MAG: sigma-54-dependent transcriptional regulator [bacterium]